MKIKLKWALATDEMVILVLFPKQMIVQVIFFFSAGLRNIIAPQKFYGKTYFQNYKQNKTKLNNTV